MDDGDGLEHTDPWWLKPWVLAIVMGLIVGACVVGIISAIRFEGADPNGPLSEWVPGTITAFAEKRRLASRFVTKASTCQPSPDRATS